MSKPLSEKIVACKHLHTYQKKNGPHLGEYCKKCDKWVGWVKKKKKITGIQRAMISKSQNPPSLLAIYERDYEEMKNKKRKIVNY